MERCFPWRYLGVASKDENQCFDVLGFTDSLVIRFIQEQGTTPFRASYDKLPKSAAVKRLTELFDADRNGLRIDSQTGRTEVDEWFEESSKCMHRDGITDDHMARVKDMIRAVLCVDAYASVKEMAPDHFHTLDVLLHVTRELAIRSREAFDPIIATFWVSGALAPTKRMTDLLSFVCV